MDSPGPQQLRFNIFELTLTLQRVLGSYFKIGGKFNFFKKFPQHPTTWVSRGQIDPSK